MKTETCKLYSRVFGIFLLNMVKIEEYNFELYRLKFGSFFETKCYNLKKKEAYFTVKYSSANKGLIKFSLC